jgi:hypothetical protein
MKFRVFLIQTPNIHDNYLHETKGTFAPVHN